MLYTLSNFDSTNLIQLIWLCISSHPSIFHWFKKLLDPLLQERYLKFTPTFLKRGRSQLWGPCIPSETTKYGSKFIEDNGELEIYKFIKTGWFYKYWICKYLMKHRHLSFLRWSWIYFSEKNMVCFVQIPQQSYLKVFQNVTLIVFCTGIYMEKNNLRVGELRC